MEPAATTKLCNKCLTEKPLEDMLKAKKYKDGRRNICKACWSDYVAIRRKARTPDQLERDKEREIARGGKRVYRQKLVKECNNKECKNLVTANATYCSRKCQSVTETSLLVDAWLRGDISGYNESGMLYQWVKKYVKKVKGNKCCLCGWAEINTFSGNIPVHVDHIDGNWRNSTLDNLRVLCPNCHSLTGSYGALNKDGRGWYIRGVRKGTGKSALTICPEPSSENMLPAGFEPASAPYPR
jgi:hypothetical protein